MQRQVDEYGWNCHSCQRSRTFRPANSGVLRSSPVPEKPWQYISMYFVIGLRECEGFDAVWMVVDRLSNMRHLVPCHTTIDAVGLAELFLREVVRLHGFPKTIVSDPGPQFA